MFIVNVETYSGYEKEYRLIEPDSARTYFNFCTQAIDAKYVTITDGLTGELFAEYFKGTTTFYDWG